MAAGSGSGAIFTEVLQIGIDTTLFDAQMKQVEAIYTASINRMPNLSQLGIATLGPQFQQVAAQFTAAAKQIETSALSVEADVAVMVAQSNANMSAMASNVKTNVAKASTSMSEGAGAFTRFGTAVERAAFRVPAMVLVGSAMIAVMAALKAPIDFVVAGFENLAHQSLPFKEQSTALTETFSKLQSITAKPIFDLVLDAMQKLNGWLKDNKEWLEQVLFAIGKLIVVDLKPLITGLDSRPTGLLTVISTILTALGYAVSTVKFLVNGLIDAGKLTFDLNTSNIIRKGLKQSVTDFKKDLTESRDDFLQWGEELTKISVAQAHALDVISGKAKDTVPNVPGVNEGQTSQEIAQEFRNKLAAIKTQSDAQKKAFEEQANAEVISRKDAYQKIQPILEAERLQVQDLISVYQRKMLAATDITNIGNSKARAKQLQLARGSLGGRGEFNQTINDQESAEKQKADKEDLAIEKINLKEKLKIEEEHYKAELDLIKKSVSEGHKTHEQGVDEEIALETKRHKNASDAILHDSFGTGTVASANQLAALQEELEKSDANDKALLQAKTAARKQDVAVLESYSAAQVKSAIASKTAQAQEAAALDQRQKHIILTKEIIQLKQQEAKTELAAAQARAGKDARDPAGSAALLKDKEEIARLKAVIEELEKQGRDNKFSGTTLGVQERAQSEGQDTKSAGDAFKDAFHLDDAAKDWDNATNGIQKLGAVAEGVAGVFQGISGAVTQAIDAYKKGGAIGAAGSLLSSGPVSDALSALPVVGTFVKPFGQILSAVSSLFSANIQRIVTDINQKISDINTQASLGNITLSQQITELQQEKQDAIQQLGGSKKKGAKSQLDAILKTLNTEIAQLQKQQKEIIDNFNQMVAAASLGSSVMTDWYTTWTQINQQVKQYVDAGGSLATAAQFLNQQLQLQQQKLQDQLNSGNQTAIGDAIQLNTLLAQRLQMVKDEAATEFGLINADSLERRTSNAVKLGTALATQRAQYALQLTDINNQVTLTQMKVDAEGKIFDINKSLADLQAASNALTLVSLNEQLAKYQDMQKLLLATKGLIFGPGNIPTGANDIFGIPGEPSVAGPIAGTINITVNGSGSSAQDAQNILQEIKRQRRSGAGQAF